MSAGQQDAPGSREQMVLFCGRRALCVLLTGCADRAGGYSPATAGTAVSMRSSRYGAIDVEYVAVMWWLSR